MALAVAGLLASKTLHIKLLRNILRCPMSFFDTTPLGRVLNRFSLDIYIIDKEIPTTLQSFLYRVLSTVGVILVISVATPIFIAVIIPLVVFYCMIQVRRQIKIDGLRTRVLIP
jgi:ABC-type multidrug transport system fused ATPase/permease subunit